MIISNARRRRRVWRKANAVMDIVFADLYIFAIFDGVALGFKNVSFIFT